MLSNAVGSLWGYLFALHQQHYMNIQDEYGKCTPMVMLRRNKYIPIIHHHYAIDIAITALLSYHIIHSHHPLTSSLLSLLSSLYIINNIIIIMHYASSEYSMAARWPGTAASEEAEDPGYHCHACSYDADAYLLPLWVGTTVVIVWHHRIAICVRTTHYFKPLEK